MDKTEPALFYIHRETQTGRQTLCHEYQTAHRRDPSLLVDGQGDFGTELEYILACAVHMYMITDSTYVPSQTRLPS